MPHGSLLRGSVPPFWLNIDLRALHAVGVHTDPLELRCPEWRSGHVEPLPRGVNPWLTRPVAPGPLACPRSSRGGWRRWRAPLAVELRATYTFQRGDRTATAALEYDGTIELGVELQLQPPEHVPGPARLRYHLERQQLLEGLTP